MYAPVDRGLDDNRWGDLVHAGPDDSAITQIQDGLPGSGPSSVAVVAGMLDALILEPDHDVLEVRTGAGWNAGLLAARAGRGMVTSVGNDGSLAAAAGARLTAAGFDAAGHTGTATRAGRRPRRTTG
ncbi:hypothetical protein ABT236_37425 [Streptomyces sp. NPDC001523]|uniref:hypothetical protein n=1 Tax=Streptomyces sp. NPDC001523 TaxID=3154383 RepID=UPI00332C6E39